MKRQNQTKANLASPFLDGQFKLIFDEENTRIFLNSILNLETPIKELTIENSESNDTSIYGRRVYFDVLCTDEKGAKFIVEMQNVWSGFLRNRLVYYSCRKINEMGRKYESEEGYSGSKSDWHYSYQPVYTICLLNDIDRDTPNQYLRQNVVLYDTDNNSQFSDRMRIILINLKMIDGTIAGQTAEYYKKYLYLLRQINENMSTVEELIAEIDSMPFTEEEKSLFRRVVSVSDISKMTRKQRMKYEEDRMFYLDQMALMNSKIEEGRAEGRAEGEAIGVEKARRETAAAMKAEGMSPSVISRITGLSEDAIDNL